MPEPVVRRGRPPLVRRLVLVVLLGLLASPYPQQSATASCAGPSLEEQPAVLARGATLTVTGSFFVDGCQDSMSCDARPGCSSCEDDAPAPVPLVGVTLELRQRGQTWVLGTAAADDAGRIAWSVELPTGVRPGSARLWTDESGAVEVRID